MVKKGDLTNDLKKERSKMGSRGHANHWPDDGWAQGLAVGSKILGRNNPRKKGRGKRNGERGMRNKN